MTANALTQLAAVIVLGGIAQWLSWRLRFPSIVLLLSFGYLAGPVTGFLSPDDLFGDVLTPLVALSVAIILFEGGLSLDFAELRGAGTVVRNLVSVGALVTWAVAAAAGHYLAGLDWPLALLLGALLVVTGPTVIQPLLRQVRPTGVVGPILKWEGIVIDPIGALLAVLVFEVVSGGQLDYVPAHVAAALLKTVLGAGGLGLIAAAILTLMVARYWVPEFLHNGVALALVVAAFCGANLLQPESGLLAVTVMGIALANQRFADLKHIVEFKENLRVFLISALFILLSARIRPADLSDLGLGSIWFLVVLLVAARPLSVLLSTVGSRLVRRERLFLMCMAPRGIVAAAVASVFALYLERAGNQQARLLVPMTFLTIIGTVLAYGLTAPWLARRLGLADQDPQGTLIVGAQPFARAMASALKEKGLHVLLVDTNRAHVTAARMAGLQAYHGSIVSEQAEEELDLSGIGRLLAMTPNDSVNVLAVQQFARVFGRKDVYQLAPQVGARGKSAFEKTLHGRILFDGECGYARLEELVQQGGVVKATNLTDAFDYRAFRAQSGRESVPLFVIPERGRLVPITADKPPEPQAGQTLVSFVPTGNEQAAAT